MRIIQKTISLEPLISRVPSVWPAYKDNKLYFFDDESLKRRNYEYPTNYGMIPLNISFSSSFVSHRVGCGGDIMSFQTLSKYYSFIRDYHYLLTNGHCGKVYSSAIDYYNSEINSKFYYKMTYGTNEEIYANMDEEYNRIGGDDFSEWINNNIIPQFEIPKEYKDYWNREYLFYSDVIKWISWFSERKNYENMAQFTKDEYGVEHWNCKLMDNDCCDCEEYFKRGGSRILDSMKVWYEPIQTYIVENNMEIMDNLSCFTPSIIDHIELQNSLSNLGQFSILAPEYEEGVDYRGANYGDSGNSKGGTVIIDESGDARKLKNGKKGFCFSPFYMEKIFDENAWDNYTTYYMSKYKEDFVSSSYTYYAFDDENRMYVGNNANDIKNAMKSGDTYDLTITDSILIDNALISIETSEYGIYDPTNPILGGRRYFVFREKETSTPYTLINGKKIYADSYIGENNFCYYFSFFKNNTPSASGCHDKQTQFNINNYKRFGRYKSTTPSDLISYIVYNDRTFEINDESGITINDIDYPRISGYTYDKNENVLYTSDGNIYDENLIEMDSAYTLHNDEKTIYVDVYNNDVIIYNAKEITGFTISKITDLATTNRLSDDTGNDIDGLYNDSCRNINGQSSAMTYAQPPRYTVLEPIYQVGNVSLIGRIKLTQDEMSKIVDNSNYFIGNIITDMEFYYNDVNGNKVAETAFKCNSSITSLSAITMATEAKESINGSNSTIIFDNNLYCDIEYYIGATLKRVSGNPFTLAEGYNYGVRYNETVKFEKKQVWYRLKIEPKDSEIMPTEKYFTKNLPHKYPIYTYQLIQDVSEIENDIYETIYQVPLAKFATEINLINSDMSTNFNGYADMDKYNGVKIAPVFMEEYNLGIVSMENIDNNIYIDRGINAAFEKHLKLGETMTLEALENYGNNYFKIMES